MMNSELNKLYTSLMGSSPSKIEELPSSGSNRHYYRLYGEKNIIGTYGTNIEENEAFFFIAENFAKKGLPVPKVYNHSSDKFYYLQEDLGNISLFNFIDKGRQTGIFSEDEKALLIKVMKILPSVQFEGGKDFDYSKCYPKCEFNKRSIMWDLNYFKYCFLKGTGIEFNEDMLEDDFIKISDILIKSSSDTFMYRDFQSRNIMIKDNEPMLIDFQGGRKGPYFYDLASFLWQAKAKYPDSLRQELIEVYIKSLSKYITVDIKDFHRQLNHFVIFRTLQVLGAYGFRGYFEKKPHFIQSIPFAIENLRNLLLNDYKEYPYLTSILKKMTELKQFSDEINRDKLTVKVMSFAYKKGIPEDTTGNGGGFVFDCRAINNPGKYDIYKPYTGLDEPVINFLEEEKEIFPFLEHAYALIDASVKRYLERGFSNLSVYFGCTGGQHRSVYSAQHLAEHLNKKFGVKVDLIHREQNIKTILKAKI